MKAIKTRYLAYKLPDWTFTPIPNTPREWVECIAPNDAPDNLALLQSQFAKVEISVLSNSLFLFPALDAKLNQ